MQHEQFEVHRLSDKGLFAMEYIADLFNQLLTELASEVPEGRELALVKTKLEEACFFAKKGAAKVYATLSRGSSDI